MADLTEVINTAESKLERMLSGEEIVMVGRMVEAGETEDKIVEVLVAGEKVVAPSDDELKTYRYEATGSGVVEIPEDR